MSKYTRIKCLELSFAAWQSMGTKEAVMMYQGVVLLSLEIMPGTTEDLEILAMEEAEEGEMAGVKEVLDVE